MKKLYLVLLIVSTLLAPAMVVAAETGDVPVIDIRNPYLRKIPVGAPAFVPLTNDPEMQEIARKAGDVFIESLDFSGYFKMMGPDGAVPLPKLDGIMASKVDFGAWKGIQAELLATVGVLVKNGQLEMECRLFDTFKESLIVGKRYRGPVADYRRMVRYFCGEVVFQLTGRQGLYESRIAFVSDTTGNKEIYICDYDGTGIRQETEDKSIALSPSWSSDGNWLAYTSYMRGNPDLYIRHLSEGRGIVVAKKGLNITPAWRPGAFSLAATLSYEGDQEIYLLTGHGKVIKKLTNSWGIDVSPAFSPDGKQMAFVSRRSGSPQIYIMDLDSGHSRRLTFEGRYNTSPAWSPDGTRIAFAGMRKGEGINVYVIGIDGTGLMQLTRKAGDNEEPSWSPDGSLIAFTSSREGLSKVYVMTAYGTDQRRLISMPGEQLSPRWSPKPVQF